MSWSIGGFLGKAPAVRGKVALAFSGGGKCPEPEEAIRQLASKIIDVALAEQDPSQVVEVSASGSMSTNGSKVVSNTLNISINPKWGFIE